MLSIIVAMDANRVIGKKDNIPWHLKADMDHFKNTTMGHVVVMGRKTYKSIPAAYKPLPGRENIVLTNDPTFRAAGCHTMLGLHLAEIQRLSRTREVFVMGGREIYSLFLSAVERLVVTHVETEIEGGDTFFPEIPREYVGSSLFRHDADKENEFSFNVVEYRR